MKKKNRIDSYTLLGDRTIEIKVSSDDIFQINGNNVDMQVQSSDDGEFLINLNNQNHLGEVLNISQNECEVLVNGNSYTFIVETERGTLRRKVLPKNEDQKKSLLTAKIPGKIVSVLVNEEQEVMKGDTLIILEAMKMQNAIASPINGRVESIFVKDNESVFKDQSLVCIVPE